MKPSRARKPLLDIILLFLITGSTAVAADSANTLRDMVGRDHLAGDVSTAHPTIKARLNAQIDAAALALAGMEATGASAPELLEELDARINAIDRDDLDTKDAERVASAFEAMLEPLGLTSSEGILNTWMYGFDPR